MTKLSPETVKSLNLTEAQAAVYIASLELGAATMQELARKSGVKRTSIYNFIDELKARHLIIETIKGKRTLYSGQHPEKLLEIERGRMREIEEALPELLAIYNSTPSKPKVTYFEGPDAIPTIYEAFIKEGKLISAWSEFNQSHERTGDLFEKQAERRAKNLVPVRFLTTDTPEAREFSKGDEAVMRQTKFVKSDKFKTKVVMYGNKVALLSYHTDPQFVVQIEDKDIAQTVIGLFEELWKRL